MNISAAHTLTVFLVAVWGYTALLLTGEFSVPVLIAAYVLAGAAFVFRLRNLSLPAWVWNILSLLALVVTLGMASRQLLDATVYLFLFLQMVKLFTARTPNEMRWCYVISLFHVIGASVLTTSMSFGVVFLGYVLLMIFSLLLYTLRRESEQAEKLADQLLNKRAALQSTPRVTQARLPVPWALTTPTPRGLVWISGILLLLVILGTLITFALVPRLATQNLFQGYGSAPEKPSISAFDESIEFGTFEKIQLDSAVAMYVQPQPAEGPPLDHVRLRGVALDTFDGRAWRRTSSADYTSGNHTFRPFTTRVHPHKRQYRMIQPPGVTNYLFGDTFPETLSAPSEVAYYLDSYSGAAWLTVMHPKEFQYTIESRVERLDNRHDPAERTPDRKPNVLYPVRGDSGGWSNRGWNRLVEEISANAENTTDTSLPDRGRRRLAGYLDRCTSIPAMLTTDRIRSIAREWTEDSTTSYEMALALERRFRTEFGYTLEPKSRGNFIEDFLVRTKEGHCEYFATSMAVLCRTLGLPTRVVNGYYCVEWNTMGGNFTVRQRDAHSWVEVWLSDEYGWMTFDPTPPSGVGRPVNRNAAVLGFLRLSDAFRVIWYRYVVDYSINDQAAIMRTLMQARNRLNEVFSRLQKMSPFSQSSSKEEEVDNGRATIFNIVVASLLTLLVVVAGISLISRLRLSRRKRADSMVRYYSELLRLLARRGLKLQPGQTPREFATGIARNPGMEPIVPITEYYYGSRYLGLELTNDQAEMVAQFRRWLQKKRDGAS